MIKAWFKGYRIKKLQNRQYICYRLGSAKVYIALTKARAKEYIEEQMYQIKSRY